MEQKPKLELPVNVPTQIRLLNDKCIEGSSQYGVYHLYNIVNGDGQTEYSLFAQDELHKQLKLFKKNDELLVTKLAASRDGKIVVTWEVKKIGGNEVAAKPTVTEVTNEQNTQDDFYYTAMEKSFDEAVRLQQKFNGMANVNQIAITLFIQRTKGNHSFTGG